MLSLETLLARMTVFIKSTCEIMTKAQLTLNRSFRRLLSLAKKVYIFLTMVVTKTCDSISFALRATARSILFTVAKICALTDYIHRRVYIWKILSARYKWYQGKKGNLYNPKLNAIISPSWVCTWNLSRFDDHFNGLESQECAQNIAFKMWMKKRLLQKRLKSHGLEARVPFNLTEKICANPRILPNKIHLRDAVPNDMTELLTLLKQGGYPQNDGDMQAHITTYLDEGHHHILVAIKGKKIVGFIAFVIYNLFISEGKRCRIEGLVVDANQPDLAVKRKLMQAAETAARENNGKVIDLIDSSCRIKDGTHDFYKFLGYNNEGTMAKVYLRKEL